MRILVTFAVEAEFAPWRSRHDFRAAKMLDDAEVYSARIGDVDVAVGLTGIGPEAASKRICDFTWGEIYDLCISSGFAGALRTEHQIAQVLAARTVIPDVPTPGGLTKVESTPRLLGMAESCGAKVVDAFYSTRSPVALAEQKKALRPLADAVEMESFEILSEAYAWMGEGIAIRAISDDSNEDLPLDFANVIGDSGKISMARLAGQVLLNPAAIPGLMRLGRRSGEAAGALADFLDSYITALAPKKWIQKIGSILQ